MKRTIGVCSISLAVVVLVAAASAQVVKVQGLIKGRSGETMIVQTAGTPKLIVLLTDNTQAGQVKGVFKARRKEMSMAALVPGAMGESRQVGSDKSAEGQAENRRVVVRILQNKGIAGI